MKLLLIVLAFMAIALGLVGLLLWAIAGVFRELAGWERDLEEWKQERNEYWEKRGIEEVVKERLQAQRRSKTMDACRNGFAFSAKEGAEKGKAEKKDEVN